MMRDKLNYAYIMTTNDKGRIALLGPYIPGSGDMIETDMDKIDRPSKIIYLPTKSIHAASSMIRKKVLVNEGIENPSASRLSHDVNKKRIDPIEEGGI